MMMKDEIINRIKQMDESYAKKLLAKIFLQFDSVGYGGKTKQEAFDKIEEIYNEEIHYASIFESDKDK